MSSDAEARRARHNVELFEQGLAAFAERGAEALVDLLDPEVEIHVLAGPGQRGRLSRRWRIQALDRALVRCLGGLRAATRS